MRDLNQPLKHRIIYRAFDDVQHYLNDLYSVYKTLYSRAPYILNEQALTDPHTLEYCRKRKFFIIIVPYSFHGEFLVERAFANSELSWVLLGGSLRHDFMETFLDAASRHANRTMNHIELGEIEPVAFMENQFSLGDQKHSHFGIAFVARIRNLNPDALLKETTHSRGYLLPYSDGNARFSLPHNQQVADLARAYLSARTTLAPPEEEIAENVKYTHRYLFHSKVVKPLFRTLGRVGFEYSLQDLEKKINSIMNNGSVGRFLDVACGENKKVYEIATMNGIDIVVGNDVSWSQIQLLAGESNEKLLLRNKNATVLFTNHDARQLPFEDRTFDFVLCKNVLHHMDTVESVNMLISEIARVGKRSLVVEIMDPQYESSWGRLRHKYYLRFLHDAGEHFLSQTEFAEVTKQAKRTSTFEMRTIRGVYQFALFDNS